MSVVFAAPVIQVGTGDKVVGWSTFPDRLHLRDDVEINGVLWRVSSVHHRGVRCVEHRSSLGRLEVLVVRVSAACISRRDNAILALANRNLEPGDMANEIRRLGLSDIRYYQRLNHLISDPQTVQAALARYPLLVNRLRRLRDGRRRHLLGDADG